MHRCRSLWNTVAIAMFLVLSAAFFDAGGGHGNGTGNLLAVRPLSGRYKAGQRGKGTGGTSYRGSVYEEEKLQRKCAVALHPLRRQKSVTMVKLAWVARGCLGASLSRATSSVFPLLSHEIEKSTIGAVIKKKRIKGEPIGLLRCASLTFRVLLNTFFPLPFIL